MNCLYYSLNYFSVDYINYQHIKEKIFEKNIITNSSEFLKLFKKSLDSVKKHNPNLQIKIFSTKQIENLDVEIFELKETSSNINHKHLHYDKLKDFKNVLYIDFNVLVNIDLNILFKKYTNGLFMRFKDENFNDSVIFSDQESRKKIMENNRILLTENLKPIDENDVGLGGDECLENVQFIKNYFYKNIKVF